MPVDDRSVASCQQTWYDKSISGCLLTTGLLQVVNKCVAS